MPTIQSAELWRESGRYDDYGKEMLRIQDRHERDMLYGPTNEEMITEIFRAYVRSYKDLPLNLYHVQWKFRDEVRPPFGLMRGREFRRGRGAGRNRRQMDVALRRDVRQARRGGVRRASGGQAGQRARHRGRPHLQLRHQIFRADEGRSRRPRRRRARGAYGLL